MDYIYTCTFQYSINYVDDMDGTVKKEKGILMANSFSKAAETLEKYYGKENLESIEYLFRLNDCFVLTKEEIEDIDWLEE